MKTTTNSYIDARAVARELLEGAEVAYGYPGERDRVRRRVTLPDGRVASLAVVFDEDAGIGRWTDSHGREQRHHDDIFGTFAHRDTSESERPTGFDGRARVLRPRDNGARIGGPVWWQPPADVAAEHLPDLEKMVRAYMETGDWFHVGLVVSVEGDGEGDGGDSIWGVDWGHEDADGSHADYLASTVADCLEESGIGRASTAGAPRWARDPLEAIARRLSGEDPDDGDAPAYHATLRDVVAWFDNYPEEWDRFAAPMVDRMESEYRSHAHAAALSKLPPERHHEDCDYRVSSAAAETADAFGTDDSREVFPCNLRCDEEEV